jgi:DNA-binding transcriptional regulator YiaG
VLLRNASISRPVDVARTLKALGLSLRKAHHVLDRLAEGKEVPVELNATSIDQGGLESLRSLGIEATRIAPPLQADVRAIREKLGLSQVDFAARFGLEVDTIRNWEQARYAPDRAALVLLAVIEHNPEAVDEVLAGGLRDAAVDTDQRTRGEARRA